MKGVRHYPGFLPMAVGCVRVRTSITVSPDDRVSGQIIAAAKQAEALRIKCRLSWHYPSMKTDIPCISR